ncbi:MAG: 23S rRNA (uracil(1939)-C(5))-methyltransferase RlmD, partial [Tissierellia bacterium]|nr:23S rRNA (uracil(1939)-C(5))-methyltransferase RlmD [Tissierellia bacterium]
KVIFGENYIEEKFDNLTFKLSPSSFYQINTNMMKKLYDKTIEYVTTINNNTILDLYCGIGTITTLLASHAKRVVGIEMVKTAIDNATDNLAINGINNVIFMHGKVENVINSLEEETIDTVVMDPPRNGVDKKALDTIIKISPKQIVYVSCNPVTLARDLKILNTAGYKIIEVTPFDMFPQTSHVETVCLIEASKS